MRQGFTLIEAMLVLGIVSILTVVSLTYLSPSKNLAKARNAQRITDVRTILNGLHQYATDHGGNFPSCINASLQNICTAEDCSGVYPGCSLYQIVGRYLVAIPVDPSGASGNDSNYDVQRREDGRLTIYASKAEKGKEINVTR